MFEPDNLLSPMHNDTRSRLYGKYPSHKYRPDCGYKISQSSSYKRFPIFIGYQLLHFGHSLPKRAYILFLYFTEALVGSSDAPLILKDIIEEMEKGKRKKVLKNVPMRRKDTLSGSSSDPRSRCKEL